MTGSNVACPHCRGAVRVAAEMAGQPVRCPLCNKPFQVPSSTSVGATGSDLAGAAKTQDSLKNPNAEAPLRFACPNCNSPFQVARTALGTTVACPSCQGPVLLPATEQESKPTEPAVEKLPQVEQRPPNPAAVSPAAVESVEPESVVVAEPVKKKTVDDLLPPKCTVELPPVQVARKSELLGGVALSETPKKALINGQVRNLVRVSDEEKLRRRRIRNALMCVLGMGLLLAAAKMLMR